MKVTIVYDNEVSKKGLKADWGFSCLVEADPVRYSTELSNGARVLFDTGTSGSILLHNMEKLNIDPGSVGEIFISHAHWDHIGGLSGFLKVNKEVKVYVPSSCSKPRGAKEVVSVGKPLQIHENIFSTGELGGMEQSLVVRTGEGLVVVDGCSHPGVGNILKAASEFGEVYALVGGLHGFREFDLLSDLKVVCPCHCTQYISEIKRLYPEKYIGGGAGKILEL